VRSKNSVTAGSIALAWAWYTSVTSIVPMKKPSSALASLAGQLCMKYFWNEYGSLHSRRSRHHSA
jgi:hypothetical protein